METAQNKDGSVLVGSEVFEFCLQMNLCRLAVEGRERFLVGLAGFLVRVRKRSISAREQEAGNRCNEKGARKGPSHLGSRRWGTQ